MSTNKQLKYKNILRIQPVVSPEELQSEFAISKRAYKKIAEFRKTIKNILHGQDNRLLVIIGPCSVHDKNAVLDYAQNLRKVQSFLSDKFFFILRLYFEKPRTALGWRGLIVEPDLDGLIKIERGLKLARSIACKVAEMELPIAMEFLDPIIPQYLCDLVSWASVGARSSESQIHRELASGLPMPVGFKNSTDGDFTSTINAIISAEHPHGFLGISENGESAIMHTAGNQDAHLVLRGADKKVNYTKDSIKDAIKSLRACGLEEILLVDCSHGNSGKKAINQIKVFNYLIEARSDKNFEEGRAIRGLMVESFLKTGKVNVEKSFAKESYGFSITDECLGWSETFSMLKLAYEKLNLG